MIRPWKSCPREVLGSFSAYFGKGDVMEQHGHRIVEIQEYLPALMGLLDQGKSVTLTVTGNSMSPFLIHGRDAICFRRPAAPLERGDMAFFRRETGACVMHRVIRRDEAGRYYLVGDGQQAVEGPVAPEQVFAVVTGVRRKGRWIGPESFWWRFFAGPWLWLLPVRPLLRRGYGVYYRCFKRGGGSHGTAG